MDENSKKEFVLDASFILAHLLPDEKTKNIAITFKSYIDKKVGLISTPLLPFEVINGLKSGVLRKRITESIAIELTKLFLDFEIGLISINYTKVLSYALKNSLSVYDASYVILAQTRNIPLLTLDKTLKKLSTT